jgi:hypothetical protein
MKTIVTDKKELDLQVLISTMIALNGLVDRDMKDNLPDYMDKKKLRKVRQFLVNGIKGGLNDIFTKEELNKFIDRAANATLLAIKNTD